MTDAPPMPPPPDDGDAPDAAPSRRLQPDPDLLDAPTLPERVAGLLDAIDGQLERHVAFPTTEHRHAVTLWVLHTHCVAAADSTPRLALLSAEKQSGKTRTLELLDELCNAPMHASTASAAVMFRAIDAAHDQDETPPTVLLDEADTIFGHMASPNEELRGLLNAGHRRGVGALRVVGDGANFHPKRFEVFAPVAVAGIGDLPDTLMDRSVVVRMRRRRPDQPVAPFRHRQHAPGLNRLRDTATTLAGDVVAAVDGRWPDMPPGVEDRAADVWEPLLQLADAAGATWAAQGRAACVTIVGAAKARDAQEGSLGVRLLDDLRTVWPDDADHAFTATILDLLTSMPEAPWADLRGNPLDARGLARLLKPYEISSQTVRRGESTAKGYNRSDLYDPWARYLPPTPSDKESQGSQPSQTNGSGPDDPSCDVRDGRNGTCEGEGDPAPLPGLCRECDERAPIEFPIKVTRGLCAECVSAGHRTEGPS